MKLNRDNGYSVLEGQSLEISREAVEYLLNEFEPVNLSRGDILLKEGQVCKKIYFIEFGQLRTYYNKGGREINLNFSFENSFVTHYKSLLSGVSSDSNIEAAEHSQIRQLERDDLFKLNKVAGLNDFGCNLLEQLLIRQEEHSNIFKLYSPHERYFYIMKYYPILLQRVSLSQLSSYLGISRETISRIRRKSTLMYNR